MSLAALVCAAMVGCGSDVGSDPVASATGAAAATASDSATGATASPMVGDTGTTTSSTTKITPVGLFAGSKTGTSTTTSSSSTSSSASTTSSSTSNASAPLAAATPAPSSSSSDPLISSSDSRKVWWISPYLRWSELPSDTRSTIVNSPDDYAVNYAEPGVYGGGSGELTLGRVTDPLNSSKMAYVHRVKGAWPTYQGSGSRRAEIKAQWSDASPGTMRIDTTYWMAVAFKLDANLFPKVGQFDEQALIDFHHVPDPGEDTTRSSPFFLYVGAYPSPYMNFVSRYSSSAFTTKANTTETEIWRDNNPSTTQWQYFVLQFKLHWDPAKGPFFRIWRAVGDGTMEKIVDRAGPNWFNDQAVIAPQKFGLYRYTPLSGSDSRTVYSKGMYIFRDGAGSPSIDQASLLRLLRSQ